MKDVKSMSSVELDSTIAEFCNMAGGYFSSDLKDMNIASNYLDSISKGYLSSPQPNRIFLLQLLDICNPGIKLWDNGNFLGNIYHGLKTANATARQRAEAFVLMIDVLKLWNAKRF